MPHQQEVSDAALIRLIKYAYEKGYNAFTDELKRVELTPELPTILGCPFCGIDNTKLYTDGTHYYVECPNCSASGPWNEAAGHAIERWNKSSLAVARVKVEGRY